MREAVRLSVHLSEQAAYREIAVGVLTPTDRELGSDQALDDWLLRNIETTQHMSGTCKMGPGSDPLAVVDEYCLVRGVDNLRVVDLSVAPNVVRANTNATAIMIGERVAGWIK